ncbi:hypothetical protein CQW23_14074 [Capsicum baccatum]|uniref:Uncharacterized protein n=1 Tax=Capsicum baccatum TaxID=33114 RepID=A0A2G2WI40_CAPBA|nr:hypothetical protein CQW23_14074 [Capsicum baccatum]
MSGSKASNGPEPVPPDRFHRYRNFLTGYAARNGINGTGILEFYADSHRSIGYRCEIGRTGTSPKVYGKRHGMACVLFAPTKANLQKSFHQQFLPLSAPDVIPSEQVELDFSDVFGPPPCLASNETSNGIPENVMFPADMSELVYDDPEIVHSRSHSLVGPSSYKNQVLKLGRRLTIHEVEHSLKLVENVIEQTIKEDQG